MKRKAAALLTAMLVMAMGSMTVSAAESPSADATTTNSNVVEEIKVGNDVTDTSSIKVAESAEGGTLVVNQVQAADKVIEAAVAEATAWMKDLKGLAETIMQVDSDAGKLLSAAATDESYTVTAELKAVVDLSGDPGTYTLNIPGIGDDDVVYLLHLNATTGEWETIPAKNLKGGNVQVTFEGFSDYGIVTIAVIKEAAPGGNPEEEPYDWAKWGYYYHPGTIPSSPGTSPADSGTAAAAAATGTATVTAADGISPKTGAEFPAAAVIAVICLAGVAVCRRKVKFS